MIGWSASSVRVVITRIMRRVFTSLRIPWEVIRIQVLQCHIVIPDGVQDNRNNSTTLFMVQPDAPTEYGGTVVWH